VNSIPRPATGSHRAFDAWPGSLAERAVGFLAADFRRSSGPVSLSLLLAAGSVSMALRPADTLTPGVAVPLAVAATAPLAMVRRFPSASLGLVLAANACYLLFPRLGWSAAAGIAWLIALGVCPNLLPRRTAVAVGAAMELVVLSAARLPASLNDRPWDATVAEALAVATAMGAGEIVRARREQTAAAAEVRALRERTTLARERTAIARELHDVVAHHVSLIAIRAATAPYAIPGLVPEGHAAFKEIAAESRIALGELRVILGVLRGPDGQPEAAPQPGIADLGELLARIGNTGTDVAVTVRGERPDLPDSVELCVYRIVQEAMTNVSRHAPGATTTVDLRYAPAEVRLRIHDSGPARNSAWKPNGVTAAGFGLLGMRERVAALGGSFEAGPDGNGGFAVSACLPVSGGNAHQSDGRAR
jgi:signal transduction histidine kinase